MTGYILWPFRLILLSGLISEGGITIEGPLFTVCKCKDQKAAGAAKKKKRAPWIASVVRTKKKRALNADFEKKRGRCMSFLVLKRKKRGR